MPSEPSLTEQLQRVLPQAAREAAAEPLRKLAELEQASTRAVLEREFLLRAARQGLHAPDDALKLADLHATVQAAPDTETGLRRYFETLRASRPWLFAPAAAPGTEKLADTGPDPDRLRKAMTHGALTRQLQATRIKRR
jgi:hypothetical protein